MRRFPILLCTRHSCIDFHSLLSLGLRYVSKFSDFSGWDSQTAPVQKFLPHQQTKHVSETTASRLPVF